MFTARMFASTTMSEVVFQVVDFDGKSIFATRNARTALIVAARCNTGDMRVFSSDYSGS